MTATHEHARAERPYTLAEVKARGWSPKLIETVLGEPDTTRANPRYRRAARTKLWSAERVAAAELLPAFVAYQVKRIALSARSKAVAQRKRAELLTAVEALVVTVEVRPLVEVRAAAVAYWEARGGHRRRVARDGGNADAATRERWTVNYVRHQLCEYDQMLVQVAGKVGVGEAGTAIRRKVYAAIASAYPALADECRRQAKARGA